MAACLAWGEGAVVSHAAAAALRNISGFAARGFALTVPGRRQRAYAHDIHRSSSLPEVDVTRVDGIPVTTVARTLIDLASTISVEALEEALDDALRRRLVTVSLLRWRLRELGGRGRQGSGVLAALIDARANAGAVPQSVLETRLLRTLREARLPIPELQHEVRTSTGRAILDFAYVEERVAIETDGFRWHSDRRRWDHDRARRNALTMLGWRLLHVTWPQLRDRPDEVVGAVRAMLF